MITFLQKQWNRYRGLPVAVKASMWFMVCSILQKCITFITLPLFTRLLTTEQYGYLSVYQSFMGILCIFLTLNLQYGSLNRAFIKYEEDRDGYIASVQGIATMLTIVAFVIYFINIPFWNRQTELPTILMTSMFLEILFALPLGLWSAKQRFDFKYRKLVILTVAMAVISPVVGLIAVLSTENRGVARIVSFAAVNILVGLWFYIYNLKKGKKLFCKKYWSFALKFNIPLIPYYLSQVVFNVSDRIMISRISGTDKAGIYSVAYQIGLIFNFVLNAVNNSFVPWMYQKMRDEEERDIAPVANGIALLMAFLLVGIMLFAPEIILIMGGAKYYEAIWVVPPVAASMLFLFLTQLSVNLEFFYEKNKYLVMGSIGSALLNVGLNLVCIKAFGYLAAGYTTLASYIVFWLANHFFVGNILRSKGKKVSDLFDMRFQVVLAIGFLGVMLAIVFLYRLTWLRYGIIAVAAIIVLMKLKYIIAKVKSVLGFKKGS